MKNMVMRLRTLLAAPLLAAPLLAAPLPAFAQTATAATVDVPFMAARDVDSTSSYEWCRMVGTGNISPFAPPYKGVGTLATVGSTTSITTSENIVGGNSLLVTGALIHVLQPQPNILRSRPYWRWLTVTSHSGTNSLTVNTPVDFETDGAAATWEWWGASCSSADQTFGWVALRGYSTKVFTARLDQVDITGTIEVKVQCQNVGKGWGETAALTPINGSTGVVVCDFTGANALSSADTIRSCTVPVEYDYCRVGARINGTDDGADTTTHRERLQVSLLATVDSAN